MLYSAPRFSHYNAFHWLFAVKSFPKPSTEVPYSVPQHATFVPCTGKEGCLDKPCSGTNSGAAIPEFHVNEPAMCIK